MVKTTNKPPSPPCLHPNTCHAYTTRHLPSSHPSEVSSDVYTSHVVRLCQPHSSSTPLGGIPLEFKFYRNHPAMPMVLFLSGAETALVRSGIGVSPTELAGLLRTLLPRCVRGGATFRHVHRIAPVSRHFVGQLTTTISTSTRPFFFFDPVLCVDREHSTNNMVSPVIYWLPFCLDLTIIIP